MMPETTIKKLKNIFPTVDWDSDIYGNLYIAMIRTSVGVKELSHKEWFWFHPSAFRLIFIGAPVIGLMILLTLLIIDITIWDSKVAFVVICILLIVNLWIFFKKVRQYRCLGDTNFYDIFLK